MTEEQGVIVGATKGQIKEFKESILWKDFNRELKAWKRGFKLEMETIVDDAETNNPSTASILLHMGDVNGRIKAVDYILSIPDIFLQILEDQKDDSERE